MLHFRRMIVVFAGWTLLLGACKTQKQQQPGKADFQVAFLSDVHLQNIFGHWSDNSASGAKIPGTNQYVLARTMGAQLRSTRLFNENYFAFRAALDNVVHRHINYVVLSGDFTDDGQPLNVRGVKEILQDYQQKDHLHFFIIPGNHDPVRPFTMDALKTDYIASDGAGQIVESKQGMEKADKASDHVPVITRDIRHMGYKELLTDLADYGFFPKKTDRYWATPFSNYNYATYDFLTAKKEAALDNRTYREAPYFNQSIIDASYVVEPVKGIWFLGIDGDVFLPHKEAKDHPENPENYDGASTGWNQIVTQKPYLIPWIKKVAADAKRLNKRLVVYCHFPMIDFNNHASSEMQQLLGPDKLDLHRVPSESVSQLLAETGIHLNFAGHIHINNTGFRSYGDGSYLVNVQVPSLAAFLPAYKILSVHSQDRMEIQTVVLNAVPGFKSLFPLYRREYAYLNKHDDPSIWDESILNATNYLEYTSMHLDQLVRLRFLKKDWPTDFVQFMENSSGEDLLRLVAGPEKIDRLSKSEQSRWTSWTGETMIADFYHLRGAGTLALNYLNPERLKQYRQLIDADGQAVSGTAGSRRQKQVHLFLRIVHQFLHAHPSDHFRVTLNAPSDSVLRAIN